MKKYVLLITFIVCFTRLFGGQEIYDSEVKAVGIDVFVTNKDLKFGTNEWSRISQGMQVKNYVKVFFKDGFSHTGNLDITINLKIESSTIFNSQDPVQLYQSERNITLHLNYQTGVGISFQKEDVYELDVLAHALKVTVTGITGAAGLPNDAIFISSCMFIERSFQLDYMEDIILGHTLNGTNAVNLNWVKVIGADEYDLEWGVIDKYTEFDAEISDYLSGDFSDLYFRNKATRVNLTDDNYKINLIYDGAYLIARVRAVHYDSEGIRQVGKWNYNTAAGQPFLLNISAMSYEPNLNWKYDVTYAEEGKRKEVVSYFDGSLKNRQTVSYQKDKNEEVAVVKESIYDEFGRLSADILPSPIKNTNNSQHTLKYHTQVNQFRNDAGILKPFSYESFAENQGLLYAKPLDSISGTAKYYSSQNDFISTENLKAYAIPKAEGYPYALTQYASDPTGRIKAQGGVGRRFQPGLNEGKPSRYFYGKPEQWELDQLFGNDIGYASHYTKEVVIDPNGQASVSYKNLSGKVVATALTGESPSSLDSLPGKVAEKIVESEVINYHDFTFDSSKGILKASVPFNVSSLSVNNLLKVSVPKLIYTYQQGNFTICSNCHYTLKASVKDEFGDEKILAGTALYKIGDSIPQCNGTGVFNDGIALAQFTPGTYYVSIEMSISEEVTEHFVDHFVSRMEQEGAFKTKGKFVMDILNEGSARAVLLEGVNDCETCDKLLSGDFKQQLKNRLISISDNLYPLNDVQLEAWAEALKTELEAKCEIINQSCQPSFTITNACDVYRKEMLADLSPGGQYALFSNTFEPTEKEVNVLWQKWRLVFPVKLTTSTEWQSKKFITETGEITSPHDANFTIAKLVQYWNSDWASLFISYHPEYCRLKFCEDNEAAYRFEQNIRENYNERSKIGNIASGLAYSYTTPEWLISADASFNAGGILYDKRAEFIGKLQNYTAHALEVAGLSLSSGANNKSITQFVDFSLYCAKIDANQDISVWNNCNIATNDACRLLNKEWQMYYDTYFKLRETYLKEKRDAYCASVGMTCQIGPYADPNDAPIPPVVPGLNTTDYVLEEVIGQSSCGDDFRKILLKRLAGGASLTTPIQVKLYYPDNFKGVLPSYIFSGSQTVKEICLPASLNPSEIKILEILEADGRTLQCSSNIFVLGRPDPNDEDTYLVHEAGYGLSLFKVRPKGENYTGCGNIIFSGNNLGAIDIYNRANIYKLYDSPVSIYSCSLGQYVAPPQVLDANQFYNDGIIINYDYYYTNYNYNTFTLSLETEQLYNRVGAGFVVLKYTYKNEYDDEDEHEAEYIIPVNGLGNYEFYLSGYHINITDSYFYLSYNLDSPIYPVFNIGNCPPALLTKKSRFDFSNGVGLSSDVNSLTTSGLAQIKVEGDKSCEANADNWVRTIYPDYPSLDAGTLALANQMRVQFVAICQGSVGQAHPNGANSNMADINNPSHTSFGKVIKNISGNSYYTAQFNPYLIEQLYPFGKEVKQTAKSIDKITPDIIARYQYFVSQVPANSNLYDYLLQTFAGEMILKTEDIAELQRAIGCYGTSTHQAAGQLDKSINLPPFFLPGGTVNLTEYQAAKGQLQAEFNNNLSESDANYEAIFAGFMNQHFGFAMAYHQYQAYEVAASQNSSLLLFSQSVTVPFKDPYLSIQQALGLQYQTTEMAYLKALNELKATFRKNYEQVCSQVQAKAKIATSQSFYHFTLYYYDQAGNLLKTVPPEGVKVLNEGQTAQASLFRQLGNPTVACSINGFNTDKAASFNSLQQAVSSGAASLEFWFYKDNPYTTDFVATAGSGQQKYLIVVALRQQKFIAEIYQMDEQSGAVTINYANKRTVDISGIDVYLWNHLVLRGNQIASEPFDIYLNGVKAVASTQDINPGVVWQIAGSPIQYPENLSALKHLRVYSGLLGEQQIAANAKSFCFEPSPNYLTWYRDNIPTQPGPTTLGASLQEGRAKETYPTHYLASQYAYQSLNQVSSQKTPDAGISKFYYDDLGRLFASQNAKQALENKYSYTLYDAESRVKEVGEKTSSSSPAGASSSSFNFSATTFLSSGSNAQIVKTFYDSKSNISSAEQPTEPLENSRKRVVSSISYESQGTNSTYYSYDLSGNVKTIYQKVSGIDQKRIDYDYDLISGKVNMVAYQHEQADRFYYEYDYDTENRLTRVYSSRNGVYKSDGRGSYLINKERDARYHYYLHGPLARIEYAKPIVQGVDYAYTLQGWLKGVNSSSLGQSKDIGKDGLDNTIPEDVLSYSLDYYQGDYQSLGNTAGQPFSQASSSKQGASLYNGNIRGMGVNNKALGNPYYNSYRYDQLNRLKQVRPYTGLNTSSNSWEFQDGLGAYQENFSYDANGNIQKLNRTGASSTHVDSLIYSYPEVGGQKQNNRLRHVKDLASSTGPDIGNQIDDNYAYDAIGNLTGDQQSGLSAISWNVYGKIKSIDKTGTAADISYAYDAAGNRVKKTVGTMQTYYIRDAQGNTLAVYKQEGSNALQLEEQQLYGSSRLGVWKAGSELTEASLKQAWQSAHKRGYELSNHLGNVLSVISGEYVLNSLGVKEAVVLSAEDYYAFGSKQSGRSYTAQSSSSYAYGFNGQMKEDEISGEGNHNTALYWEYDTRLGRRWNLDPKPVFGISDYATLLNNPIWTTDVLGDTVRLSFDGRKNKITIYGNTPEKPEYKKLGEFDAHNNTIKRSQGKWEDGTYEMRDKLKTTMHGNNSEKGIKNDSRLGMYGKFGAYVAESFKQSDGLSRSGMAVHAGRTSEVDGVGGNTKGCIRVSEMTMREIDASIYHYGELKSITILNNKQRQDNQSIPQPYKKAAPTFNVPTSINIEVKLNNTPTPILVKPNP